MDKQDFINTVRRTQKKSAPLPEITPAETVSTTATSGSPVEAFERNFKANHGEVFHSVEDLVARLKELGCKKGVADAKLESTLGLESQFDIVRDFDRSNPDQYDFGVSKASFAIAENGTMALKDCDTADRLITIAPWVHVAVLKKSDIVLTMGEGFAQVLDNTPYTILVAGPSKTTDVEGILVEGVHGPGKEFCLLL